MRIWNWMAAGVVIGLLGGAAGGAGGLLKDRAATGLAASAPARAAAPEVKDPHHRRNLFGKVDKPRFEVKDIDWPEKVGGASICLS